MLFGPEVSKGCAINIGEHAILHVPSTIERLVEPLEKVGERLEEAIKDEYGTDEKPNKEAETEKKE